MTAPRPHETTETSLTQDLVYMVRYYLGGRRALLIITAVAIVAGLALNWGWLVAAGIAPLLIAVLPCLAMCALGLCMSRMGSSSCSAAAKPDDSAAVEDAVETAQAVAVDASPEPAALEPPLSGNAAPLPNPELQPSNQRRPTDA